MKNQSIVKSIIILLEEYHNIQASNGNNVDDLKSLNYLIGQLIRQYNISPTNMHVSVNAQGLWSKLSSDSINNFWFRDPVKCDRLQKSIKLRVFKGSAKNGRQKTFNKNDSLCFNDVFHVDHIVPVSLIKEEILNLDNPTILSVESILDKMHLCRILKEEDREMGRTKDRTIDWQDNIKNVYGTAGISIV